MIDVSQAVAEYVREREKVWSNDRGQTVGASEIGQCSRKIWALKFEFEPGVGVARDDDFVEGWGARERGNLIEQHLLVPAIFKRYRERAQLLGPMQQTFIDGYASCTPDCLIVDEDEQTLIEFKSIDPRANLDEPKPEHVYQAQVQLGMLNTVTPWRPKRAVLHYTNASFFNESKEFVIEYDPKIYAVAKTRATRIMTAESIHELPPEGYIAGGKECDYCPFTKACGQSRRRIPDEDAALVVADPQFVAEISDRAKQLKYIEAAIALQEKQKREIQTEIKDRLREKGLRRVVGDGVSVSWSPVKGREGYDMPALLDAAHDAGVRVEEFSKPGEPGDRLTVSLKPARKEAA
jgi:hypothetical protein